MLDNNIMEKRVHKLSGNFHDMLEITQQILIRLYHGLQTTLGLMSVSNIMTKWINEFS